MPGNRRQHGANYSRGSYEPGTFMCIGRLASVGGSLPIALGAKLARRPPGAGCASGDMGSDVQESASSRPRWRETSPVVYVVFNDQGLGNERRVQQEHYGGALYAVDYQNPDFGALRSSSFGAPMANKCGKRGGSRAPRCARVAPAASRPSSTVMIGPAHAGAVVYRAAIRIEPAQ